MKRILLITIIGLLTIPFMAYAGNGAPSGTHYNLNLLGKDKCPGGDMIDSSRHTIFVKLDFADTDPDNILGNDPGNFATLDKTNKIFLSPGDDFLVTDGNACNKGGAAFTLPAQVATEYTIWVRELGKPGGYGDITLCGVDEATQEVVCALNDADNSVILSRSKGKPVFRDVTKQLTTIDYLIESIDPNTGATIYTPETAVLFDDDFYQYFWDFDNHGLRLVQLRFYPK